MNIVIKCMIILNMRWCHYFITAAVILKIHGWLKNLLIGKHFNSNVLVGCDKSFLCYTRIIKF